MSTTPAAGDSGLMMRPTSAQGGGETVSRDLLGKMVPASAVRKRPVPLSPEVRRSLRWCREVTRRRAGNFYLGLKLTPEPKRSAMFALYALMRACDDVADGEEEAAAPEQRLAGIEQLRENIRLVCRAGVGDELPAGELWPGFHYVLHNYPIEPAHLHAMLDGQRCDVLGERYQSFDDLYRYCYRVASTVGLCCLAIWGHDGQAQTTKLAEYRGVALQLTNILRDIGEDAGRGRVYLPADELQRFGCSFEQLQQGRADRSFDRLMRYQIERARGYYQMASTLERRLSPRCRPTSWAMMRIYRRLLERIATNPRQVLRGRVRLPYIEKAGIALRASWRRTWTR